MENETHNHQEQIISFFDKEIRWWTEVYREDLPKGFFSYEMRQRLNMVADLLTVQIQKMDNPNVLECGCGPGDILALLSPHRCTLTGLDLNHRYLDLAAEKVPRANLIEGNVECLPFPDASFDIVYAVGVLLYVNDDHKAAKEIARVTKEGGIVLISNPNYRMLHLLLDPYYVFRKIRRSIGMESRTANTGFDDSKMRRYSLTQLRDLFHEFDLRETRTMVTSYGPLKFWRKEVLALMTSIRISEIFCNWSERKMFAPLKRVGNHLIITFHKGKSPGAIPLS